MNELKSFGDLAIEHGCATESQVQTARLEQLRLRRRRAREILLAELLLDAGAITTDELLDLLERGRGYRERSDSRPLLGDVAVAKGYLPPLHLYLALQAQVRETNREAVPRRLGEILVARGDLSRHELADVLSSLAVESEADELVEETEPPGTWEAASTGRRATATSVSRAGTHRRPSRVGEILRLPIAVSPDATVGFATAWATARNVDSLLVMSEGRLLGCVALWDLFFVDRTLPIRSVMAPAATVSAQTSIDEATRILDDGDHPCLAVIVRGAVSGQVTRAELRSAGVPAEMLESRVAYEELGGSG
ncbi:MAG TPA: hypothetical protein VFF73_30285 [Planctomycetota bacterium]|nr:hypothetical protein [Planctomycetota bacterium]